jgi:hypothetical protein
MRPLPAGKLVDEVPRLLLRQLAAGLAKGPPSEKNAVGLLIQIKIASTSS